MPSWIRSAKPALDAVASGLHIGVGECSNQLAPRERLGCHILLKPQRTTQFRSVVGTWIKA